jgi:hypothetical protein
MKERSHLLDSPLTRVKGLQEVPAQKVADIENRFKNTYVRGMTEYQREARLRAEKVRDKILY